ncbi:MAG: serine protease [Desulfitobacteriaceae bacterium]|nr:serine protease [Desulfitobacteriaceae bacterium]
MAFVALSYTWLPSVWTINFDFLKQDKTLSEDDIVRQCRPAVVIIQATGTGEATGAQGTGFNLEPDGMIVTNRHVVEGASTVEVTFSDDKRLFSQDIDLLDGYDLAIIWLKGNGLPSLQVSDKMAEVGQSVTIIGNPRGFLGVSCRGEVKEYYRTDSGMLVFTIGVTVAPGSSGSPVLDEQGRLVGIVYAAGKIAADGEEQDRAIAIPATALLN